MAEKLVVAEIFVERIAYSPHYREHVVTLRCKLINGREDTRVLAVGDMVRVTTPEGGR